MTSEHAPLAGIDYWLASRRRIVLGVLLGLALLSRVVVFGELYGGPMFDLYKHNEMDMHFFSEWGGKLATEDLLGDESLHPMHTWHVWVAEKDFETHPPAGLPYQDRDIKQRGTAVRQLWDQWYGANRFHQEPLYAYFIAGIIAATRGTQIAFVFAVQMLLGVITVLMLYGLTRRLLGDLVGVMAALMAIAWGPLIHYEVILLRASLIVFFSVAVLYGAQRMRDSVPAMAGEGPWRWLGFGALLGVATAMKTTLLLLGLGLALGLLWSRRRDLPYLVRTVGPMLGGVLLCLAPFFIRNALVGAPLFSLTSVGAVTFAGANTPNYQPAWGWSPYNSVEHIAQVMRNSSGVFSKAVVETLALHDSLWSYCGLVWKKLLLVWHWYEMPNNTNYYYTCTHSSVLGVFRYMVAAWWVMPAGLIGMVMAWRRPGVKGWIWFQLCSIGPLVVFYTLSRFRLPMVVGLMPLAAFAIYQFVDWILRRDYKRWSIALICFVAMALFMNRGFTIKRPVLGPGNFGFSLDAHYMPKAERALARGHHAEAAAMIEEFVLEMPERIRRMGPSRLPADIFDTRLAWVFQVAHERMANYYFQAGNRPQAERCAAMARHLDRVVRQAEELHGKIQRRP